TGSQRLLCQLGHQPGWQAGNKENQEADQEGGDQPAFRRHSATSERDIVVEVGGRRRRVAVAALAAALRRRIAITALLGTLIVATAHAAAIATAIEHLHLVGNNLGGVTVLAVLPLPLAGAQTAFDIHLAAFLQVFPGDLGELVEEHHPVPLGALLHLPTLLVLPALGGCQGNVGHRAATGHKAGFRILAKIANQNDLVDTTCHVFAPLSVVIGRLLWQVYTACARLPNHSLSAFSSSFCVSIFSTRMPSSGTSTPSTTPVIRKTWLMSGGWLPATSDTTRLSSFGSSRMPSSNTPQTATVPATSHSANSPPPPPSNQPPSWPPTNTPRNWLLE